MREISESFLLTVAQIAAALLGLLLVGVFFYVETGFRRLETIGPQAGPFLRASTKLVLLLYSLVVGIALALVVLERAWVTVLFAILGIGIVRTLIEVTLATRALPRVVQQRNASPWFMWPPILVTLALPWALGGWRPDREAFTWAVLLAGVQAFLFTGGLVLSAFDLAALDAAAGEPGNAPKNPRKKRFRR